MSLSQSFPPLFEGEEARLIDRLVDGELAEDQRRALLLHLEAHPEGWRRCALAFLEAQTWREALGPLTAAAVAPVRNVPDSESDVRKTIPWRRLRRWTAIAAGLLAAFALGWGMPTLPSPLQGTHETHEGEKPIPIVHKEPVVPEEPPPEAPRTVPVAVASQAPPPPAPVEVPQRLESLVKHWEQRGYRAELQRRMVSVVLKDGRRVEVPVQEVRLSYVGGRTY